MSDTAPRSAPRLAADRTQPSQWLPSSALGLGILANILSREPWPVSGLALWVLCFSACYLALLVQQERCWPAPQRLLWIALPPVAAGLLVLRSHNGYVLLMLLLMTAATAMVVALGTATQWRSLRLSTLLRALLHSSWKLLTGLPLLLVALRNATSSNTLTPWLRGAILTLPLLAVFMLLFYQADASFSHALDTLGQFVGAEIGSHLLLSAIFAWLSGGLLYALLTPLAEQPASAVEGSLGDSLGREEITVIMGSLCLLFVSFTALQLGYLFGGSATIEATPGLGVAAYARRGFFELLLVSALMLVILPALDHMSRAPHRFRILATVLLCCVFVIQASAVQRLLLYIDHFGLTLARWMAAWMLLWLASMLAWFAIGLWRDHTQGFLFGSASLGAALLLLCLAANPAARVAAVNLDRHIHGAAPLDSDYLLRLGSDAIPTILSRLAVLEGPAHCELSLRLLAGSGSWRQAPQNWRGFSYSRWRAERALVEQRATLEAQYPNRESCRFNP